MAASISYLLTSFPGIEFWEIASVAFSFSIYAFLKVFRQLMKRL